MTKLTHSLSIFLIFMLFVPNREVIGQSISDDHVLETDQLQNILKEEVRNKLSAKGNLTEEGLADYFREKFSERFFYDYKKVPQRLGHYNQLYNRQETHADRAEDHMGKYSDETVWKLPFNYLDGSPVNAYALRHLARQHKMVDIAFLYFNNDKDPVYIEYFVGQMKSLNKALESGQYEKIIDGNGVYEVFRSGYRIMNWLWIHNMFLNEPGYTDQDQLATIATLLQHGEHLYNRNAEFHPGNHQTRGMSALAVLSILLRDFEGTERWYDRAMERLSEHLDKEINADGFQFERSVHYHMSDINNYYYVYQLAKINDIAVDAKWEEQLRGLFTTLVKIGYPDRSAPVLQDDTEIPWGEKNDISGAMTLGYVLFEDPEFGYFASDKVDDRMYWYLNERQIKQLENIEEQRPGYGSLSFPDTHYYIMREGWRPKDKMMVVSAGLDAEKPDHQHGDMLGIQAMANGQVILPNYQVRYSLKDFELFKNSMVKNVALVDDQLQGKKWTSNKGGSGFGKFKELPNPKVLTWKSEEAFDLFVGEHDGFENIGVSYNRQVIYIKDEFWIVKDNFDSNGIHDYKQIWQGHYTKEAHEGLIRATFSEASGCDILQLRSIDHIHDDGSRGKNWSVITKSQKKAFNFITVIFPYLGYHNRIDELSEQLDLKGWQVNTSPWELKGDDPVALSRNSEQYLFGVSSAKLDDISISMSAVGDLYMKLENGQLKLQLLSEEFVELKVNWREKSKWNSVSKKLEIGDEFIIDFENE